MMRIQSELPKLIEAYNALKDTKLRAMLEDIIAELLADVYEDPCTGDATTCDREDCRMQDMISEEVYRSLIDNELEEAAEIEVEYMTLKEGAARLHEFHGGRLARKGWDNGLNQEYIEWAPLVGLVKIYQTSSVKGSVGSTGTGKPYFKNVVHTYEPTADDSKATDWYFI